MREVVGLTDGNLSKIQVSRNSDEFNEDKAATGALSRWIETDKQRLRVIIYPPGFEADHICYNGHSLYMVEGSIKIEFGEESSEWKKGDAFIIPDGVPHKVLNPFDSKARVVIADNV